MELYLFLNPIAIWELQNILGQFFLVRSWWLHAFVRLLVARMALKHFLPIIGIGVGLFNGEIRGYLVNGASGFHWHVQVAN